MTDSLIYEINPGGSVNTVTTVPRKVIGWPFNVLDNAVVWACTGDSFIRVASSWSDANRGQDGSHLTHIQWYREIPIWANRKVWLRAEPDPDAACFSDQWFFRAGQGYLVKREEHVYRFQIDVIDLATGVKHTDLTLAIPFDGDFPIPKHGGFDGGRTNPTYAQTPFPHLLGIGGLQVEGTVLRVIMKPDAHGLGLESDPPETALEFDLKPLIATVKTH